ncbi:SpaH/EbpB family LPXTG-anchored major pilin [Trueperella pyogenes]|uniref:SpaH/EbpB family LPXTG-anchored major pilin n=3 Tax=Trueperella pyogenes TaxID=1661 RepID=UPI0004692D5C|nr:SpaH/EbpB family LPXTG-anchored major pilin [Trueperella pyogenes]
MTTTRVRLRSLVAFAAAAALALVAAVLALPKAEAATTGNLDTNKQGSITIIKTKNPSAEGTTHGDGTKQTPTPGSGPIQGVSFTVAKVEAINLSTNDGWETAQGLNVAADGTVTTADGKKLDTVDTKTLEQTDDKGMTKADKLPIGVYLVTETSAPTNVARKAAPFLVTVPFPNSKVAGGWIYDVVVYPKNTVLDNEDLPIKTLDVAKPTYFPGDKIVWNITQKVPQLGAGEKLSAYKITDQLPKKQVNTVAEDNIKVEVLDAEGGKVQITPKVTVSAENLVTIDFKDVLAQLNSGYTVNVTIEAVIADTVDGPIKNQSVTTVNDNEFKSRPTKDSGTEDPLPTSADFTTLTIKKVDRQGDGALPLNNAVFTVTPANAEGNGPLEGAPVKTLTTGDAGVDGQAIQKLAAGKYWVVETTAPVGFVISPEWKTGKAVDVSVDSPGNLTVINLNAKEAEGGLLPNLPLTGAQGAVLLTLLGLAIVAIAVGTGFVSVRRRS